MWQHIRRARLRAKTNLLATRGKSVAAAVLKEFFPGTFVVTVMATNFAPVASAETAQVYGLQGVVMASALGEQFRAKCYRTYPAPSALT